MSTPDESACWCEPEPRCPYCGHEQGDFWENHGEDGEHECDNCTRKFMWSRYVEVTYTTKPIIGPHRLHPSDIAEDAYDNPLEKP